MAGVDARQTAAAWFEEYRAERDRADRAEGIVAAVRAWALSPTALGAPATSRDERGNAVIAAKGQVLALLAAERD